MKKVRKIEIVLSLLFFLTLSQVVVASENPKQYPSRGSFGIGMVIPAGITLKYWTSSVNGLDLKLGWGQDKEKSRLCFDYLWHNFNFFEESKSQKLAFYYGLGGKLHFGEYNDYIGLRMVFGISYIFPTTPFDLFLELSPTLLLSPETNFETDAGIGLRYFFR